VGPCKGGQFENFGRCLLRGFDWKGLQSRQKAVNLIKCNALAAVGHQQAIADFIEPQGELKRVFRRGLQERRGCTFDPLRLPETTGAQGMRPARDHSQTVPLVNQLLDGDTFEADAVLLNEGEHFAYGLTLRAVRRPGS